MVGNFFMGYDRAKIQVPIDVKITMPEDCRLADFMKSMSPKEYKKFNDLLIHSIEVILNLIYNDRK